MCYPDSRGKCGGPSCNAGTTRMIDIKFFFLRIKVCFPLTSVELVLTLEVLSLARSLFCGDMAPKLMLFGKAISAGFPSTGPPGPSSFTLQGNKQLVSSRDTYT